MLRVPGFTAVALLTLALGIRAATAIFTLVQQVMLRSLAVLQPGQLWHIGDVLFCCPWNGHRQDHAVSELKRCLKVPQI